MPGLPRGRAPAFRNGRIRPAGVLGKLESRLVTAPTGPGATRVGGQ